MRQDSMGSPLGPQSTERERRQCLPSQLTLMSSIFNFRASLHSKNKALQRRPD